MNQAAVDKVVAAVMAKGPDFALAVMAGVANQVHNRPAQEKSTSPWVHDQDGSWVRTTWAGVTVLARVYETKKKWTVHISVEAGGPPAGGGSFHRSAKRARQIADQALAQHGWDVVAPQEK